MSYNNQDLPLCIWKLITNFIYMVTCMGSCAELVIVSGRMPWGTLQYSRWYGSVAVLAEPSFLAEAGVDLLGRLGLLSTIFHKNSWPLLWLESLRTYKILHFLLLQPEPIKKYGAGADPNELDSATRVDVIFFLCWCTYRVSVQSNPHHFARSGSDLGCKKFRFGVLH